MDEARKVAYEYVDARLANGEASEFDYDRFQVVLDYVNAKFSQEEQVILHAYVGMKREFAKGLRCAVCGRTPKQNDAIGYDCIHEC